MNVYLYILIKQNAIQWIIGEAFCFITLKIVIKKSQNKTKTNIISIGSSTQNKNVNLLYILVNFVHKAS